MVFLRIASLYIIGYTRKRMNRLSVPEGWQMKVTFPKERIKFITHNIEILLGKGGHKHVLIYV